MFLLRSVKKSDAADIFELSQLLNFINLPPHLETINDMIATSEHSFLNPSDEFAKNIYMFALEDRTTQKVIAVSLIHAQHGTEEEPHFFLKVGHESKFSESLNTGFVHGTLQFGMDTNGPTEIGALILHPSYRGHQEKLGKQISFVRFLYMSLFPHRFQELIHAELLPPFDPDGTSPLWEALGRKFLNMGYHEADVLSRKSKEFILSLFPTENIYQSLLPAHARWAIGQVGDETQPVKKMLESIGFRYTHEVDPFDGGPHYRCPLKEITLIKNAYHGKVKFTAPGAGMKNKLFKPGLIAFDSGAHLVSGTAQSGVVDNFNALKLHYFFDATTKEVQLDPTELGEFLPIFEGLIKDQREVFGISF
jgi:arginine N-succinyltransferase